MNAVPIVCAVAALPVGWLSGVLVDRVPDKLALRPLPGVRVRGRYLSIHIVMLGLFVAVGIRFDDAPALLIAGYLLLTAMLVTVSVVDILLFRLPDRIVLPALVASLLIVVVESLREGHSTRISYALAGAGMYFGLLLVIHLISPRAMGFGDVKLAAVMGLYLGWLAAGYATVFVLVVWALGIGALAGAIFGMVMLTAQGASRRAAIPFGPYLAFGTMVVVLFTPHLVTLTLSA